MGCRSCGRLVPAASGTGAVHRVAQRFPRSDLGFALWSASRAEVPNTAAITACIFAVAPAPSLCFCVSGAASPHPSSGPRWFSALRFLAWTSLDRPAAGPGARGFSAATRKTDLQSETFGIWSRRLAPPQCTATASHHSSVKGGARLFASLVVAIVSCRRQLLLLLLLCPASM